MAGNMEFDLVSPEKSLASLKVSAIDLPGSEGDMTAMPDHAALLTTLRPGLIRAHVDSGVEEFVVTGGFAEINDDKVIVLAERVFRKEDATRELVDELVETAEQSVSGSEGAQKDLEEKRLADTLSLRAALGV